MMRRSKATVARINNLNKPANPQNPTVEEVFDEEDADFKDKDFLEHGFFFLDEEHPPEDESDSSNSNDEEVDEGELTGLQNEADIEHRKVDLQDQPKDNGHEGDGRECQELIDNVPVVQIRR